MIKYLKNLFGGNNEKIKTSITKTSYLVDVRTPQEFADGNVSGSVNIPLDKIQSQIANFKNKDQIVIFCRSGMRSGQAKTILNKHGINNVINGGTWLNIKKILQK